MRRLAFAWVLMIGATLAAAPANNPPENLARRARVAASSQYSADYAAQYAVDGKVPEPGCREDARLAWCCNGEASHRRAEFTLTWDQPVTAGEIVYFGRTGQIIEECFKDYEVYIDQDPQPAAHGALGMVHGPQRIAFQKRQLRSIRIRFLNSHGAWNPGASEIAVYESSPTDEQLARFSWPVQSAELRSRLVAGQLGFKDILVIQRHHMPLTHVYVYHAEGFQPGGGLFVYTPSASGAQLRQLVASPQGEIIDCDLSFDGREVVFSWKRGGKPLGTAYEYHSIADDRASRADPDACYQVYRVNIDGTGLTRLTDSPCNNFNACWLPDGGIAYLSDRKPAYAYCFITTSPVLHRMERDGSQQRRLSSNYLMDFTPSVMNDGRILYTRWEYVDRGACPIQSLWAIHPDGTGLSGVFKNRMLSPGTFMQARVIPGSSKILCLATNHNGDCRGGICVLDPRVGANTPDAVRNVTPEVDIYRTDGVFGNGLSGPYETPFPIDQDRYLVTRDGALQLRDYEARGSCTLLRPSQGMGFYSAQPIRRRPAPPVVTASLPTDEGPWATVVLSDVYEGLAPKVKRGEVKHIAIVQEVEKSTFTPLADRVPFCTGYAANTAFGYQFPLVSCGATYAAKKIWGYADVREDGSACFKVPAEVPIYFMAIDAQGRAVQRMRTFTHLMPGETQGCVGCHADRNYVAAPGRAKPVAAEPQPLTPPAWGVKGFSYLEVVQPVLDRYCVECHNARTAPKGVDLSGDLTDFFNVSYDILARQGTIGERHPERHGVPLSSRQEGRSPYTSWISTINGAEYNILMVEPKTWGSPASKLADIVLAGHPDASGKVRFQMDPESRNRLFAWIDLNVPYYPTSSSPYPNTMGCRRLLPEQLDAVLARVAKDRCISCHAAGVPRKFYTRIVKPEHNDFLLAPLAKAAGGNEACGRVVFESTLDPDYRAILKTFEPITDTLRRTPRGDLGDSIPLEIGKR